MSQTNTFDSHKIDASVSELASSKTANLDTESLKEQEVSRYKQDTKYRHSLIVWMIHAVSIWLFVVIVIVILNGTTALDVNDNVMITLLATTTANVLGLPTIILKDLFKGRLPER